MYEYIHVSICVCVNECVHLSVCVQKDVDITVFVSVCEYYGHVEVWW